MIQPHNSKEYYYHIGKKRSVISLYAHKVYMSQSTVISFLMSGAKFPVLLQKENPVLHTVAMSIRSSSNM